MTLIQRNASRAAKTPTRSRAIRDNQSLEGLGFLWLEITPGCNLHCKHCYTESSPLLKDPKTVDWEKVLADAYRVGCRQVQFIGGEPTYNPRLVQYISTARELGYTFIEIYTNLTLVSGRLADEFRRYGVHLATSFYSSHKEIHDAITGVKGSFDKTVRGIQCVVEKRIPLRVGITSMEANKNEMKDCIDFLMGMGVDKDKIAVDHTRPVGRGGDLVELQSLEKTLCGHCWEGKLAVCWDGSCYPCIFAREVMVGNLTSSNLQEIVRSAELRQFRKRIFDYSSTAASTAAAQDLFGRLLAIFPGPATSGQMSTRH